MGNEPQIEVILVTGDAWLIGQNVCLHTNPTRADAVLKDGTPPTR